MPTHRRDCALRRSGKTPMHVAQMAKNQHEHTHLTVLISSAEPPSLAETPQMVWAWSGWCDEDCQLAPCNLYSTAES
jgi:hypothetical protein